MESLNEDAIKVGIESALYQVKTGKAYVHGLSEEDFESLLHGDGELVNELFKFVVGQMVVALSPEDKKRAKKDVREMLRSQRDKWLKVIQEYDGTEPTDRKETAAVKKESDGDVDMDVDTQHPLKIETGAPKPPKTESDVTSAVVMGTSHDGKSKLEPETSDEKRPASMDADEPVKKEKIETPQTSSKKRKSDDDVDVKKTPRKKAKGSKGPRKIASAKKKKARKNAGPSEAQLEAARESAKKEFEQEKARILAELPEDYTKLWGQVGYAKWSKQWLPCLIVGPFDVGAGTNMREAWMSMFENTRNRRHQMTNLVFWYGSDLSVAFSLVPQKDFVAYDKGVQKGHDKLPSKIQKKLDSGKGLTKAEAELVAAHEELNADLLRQPEQRLSFDGFHELYEDDDHVRSLLGAEDSDDELFSSDDDESLVSSASSSSELESDSDDDDDEKLARAKAITSKAKKKADKKKAVTVEPMEEEELSFAENEVSSDDSKDEDVILSDSSSSDDEQDEDYLASEHGAKKRKPGEPKKKKAKKEKTPTEGKKVKKPKKPPRDEKKSSEYARNRAEHKKFRENMAAFLPIVEKWKAAIKDEDTDAIDEVLKSILGRVHEMGAPFMEEYNISPLMMATKKVLRDKNADRTTQKKLMTKLGEQHKAQKAMVPPSFTLKNQKLDKKEAKRKDGKPRKSTKKPKREEMKEAEPASLNRNESATSLPRSLPASQSSAGPATPARRVHSQGSATPRGGKISPKPAMPQGSAKATTQKSEKTSFSLSSLFKKPTSSQSKSDAGGSSERPSSQNTGATKSLPSWMTTATPDDVGKLPSEKVDRLLALEFFQGTASCFPEEKVNREAIARSLEAAVYQWSLEQYKKEDAYWPKLHTVVAGICGKRKPGTLVAAIMAGEYESARDVVTLSDDMLMHSFEGS